jgi:hypothetical protein
MNAKGIERIQAACTADRQKRESEMWQARYAAKEFNGGGLVKRHVRVARIANATLVQRLRFLRSQQKES